MPLWQGEITIMPQSNWIGFDLSDYDLELEVGDQGLGIGHWVCGLELVNRIWNGGFELGIGDWDWRLVI